MFARPSGAAEVWRERTFEVVLDGVWFTGVFDRVVVELDERGRARKARVMDFKTERRRAGETAAQAVVKHTGQINLYRRVAAVLTGLPENQVECALVLTAWQCLVEVPLPA